MRRFTTAVLAAGLTLVWSASPALADFREWASSTETIYLNGGYTTRSSSDTYRARTVMTWNSSRAANMRHMAGHGYRFSQDVHDLDAHLNATSRRETNIPNPYFDLDYAFERNVEAEITSESAAFPTANVSYYTNFYFMRWHYFNGWLWDSYWGNLSYDEQLSEQQPFGDKWDTTGDFGANCCAFLGTKQYPYQGPPSVMVQDQFPTPSPVETELPAAQPDVGQAADASLEFFSLVVSPDEQGEVTIKPDLAVGLQAYAARARGLARAAVARGPSSGLITFSHPVGAEELQAISNMGVVITAAEAVSTPASDGTRWTIFDTYTDRYFGTFGQIEQEFDVEMLGVVAAEVVIPTKESLSAASAADYVWLVDLSMAQVRRAHPELEDVVMNDLYWHLAGWG